MVYEQVDRGMSNSADGATEYVLSRGNDNFTFPLNMPDTEGCYMDGELSGSDFEPPSVSATCDF